MYFRLSLSIKLMKKKLMFIKIEKGSKKMESKARKFALDKILIVAVVIGMFALAAASSIFNSNTSTDTTEIFASNISQNCMYINR